MTDRASGRVATSSSPLADSTSFKQWLQLGMYSKLVNRRRCARHATCAVIIAAITAMCLSVGVAAEPYVPAHDSEVLETLPRSLLSGRDALTALRRELSSAPDDVSLAVQVAQAYLKMGNVEGDPRFYGYARAAIKPWWTAVSPPPAILKLRAKLQEKDHRYDDALADLRLLLKAEPRDAQAWIEVANICRVQGEYAEAQKACDELRQFSGFVPTTLCQAPIQAVTGQARQAYDSLAKALPSAQTQFPSTVQFMLTMQAQIASALGLSKEAEGHFREGLKNSADDSYLIRSYADFLLDQDRAREAFDLVQDHTSDNGILLRAAIAARQCGEQSMTTQWQRQLAIRFEEIRLRGGQPHGRFEARYQLELLDDPRRALDVALANWERQKETRDSRNVLEAALAAEDPAAARPVLEFLLKHRTEDVVLQRLARQLESN